MVLRDRLMLAGSVMICVGALAATVTLEDELHEPSLTVTVYVPAAQTLIERVMAPVFQT